MSNFESTTRAIAQANTLERCSYLIGYINAEYTYDIITEAEYTALFKLIQEKRRCLI